MQMRNLMFCKFSHDKSQSRLQKPESSRKSSGSDSVRQETHVRHRVDHNLAPSDSKINNIFSLISSPLLSLAFLLRFSFFSSLCEAHLRTLRDNLYSLTNSLFRLKIFSSLDIYESSFITSLSRKM